MEYLVCFEVKDKNKNLVREYTRTETLQEAEFQAEAHYLTYADMEHLESEAYIYRITLVKNFNKGNPNG